MSIAGSQFGAVRGREWPRRRLLALVLTVLSTMTGCDRGSSAEEQEQVVERTEGRAPAAAAQHFFAPGETRPRSIVAMPPAPKPSGPLPADASCITAECHTSFANAAFVHGPISERACDSCHAPDTGGHQFPLKRNTTDTCTSCHSVAGTASHQHAALQDGCMTCHEPHVSRTKFLLKADSVEFLCASCHDVPLKKFAHDPFAKGQCTLCHQPHQADNKSLLRGGDGARHCFACHSDLRNAMTSAGFVHEPARQQCTTCHSPHATDHEHVLKQPIEQTCLSCHEKTQRHIAGASVAHAAVTQDRSCANCHNGHISAQRGLLSDRMDRTCLTCHDKPLQTPDGRTIANMKPVLTESKFLHGPIRAGECAACHDAHGTSEHSLLTAPFPETFYTSFDASKYQLCFGCHQKDLVLAEKTEHLTDFRDGEVNLHYLHVNRDPKGRVCKTCHAVHGSDQPGHMAGVVPFEGSGWAMKIEFEKTAGGGSCAPGCHAPKTYNRGSTAGDQTTRGEP